jgi:hypothetical protein
MEDIPTAAAASFFRTYFQSIHPQYPNPISGWPAFFVKMVRLLSVFHYKSYLQDPQIFAIGSLIQSKSDNAPRYQHQDLKSQAQSEDVIIRSTKSSPLVHLQAMLLSAMHAIQYV